MNNDIVEQDNADRCENSKHQNEQPSVSDTTDMNADNIFETSKGDVLNDRSSLREYKMGILAQITTFLTLLHLSHQVPNPIIILLLIPKIP